MGRRKIEIARIGNDRTRQATFTKRKLGVMKKAAELSILCGADVAVIVFSRDQKMSVYSSAPVETLAERYADQREETEARASEPRAVHLAGVSPQRLSPTPRRCSRQRTTSRRNRRHLEWRGSGRWRRQRRRRRRRRGQRRRKASTGSRSRRLQPAPRGCWRRPPSGPCRTTLLLLHLHCPLPLRSRPSLRRRRLRPGLPRPSRRP